MGLYFIRVYTDKYETHTITENMKWMALTSSSIEYEMSTDDKRIEKVRMYCNQNA